MNQINVMEFQNQRVLTTSQISESFGVENKLVTNNFSRNKERYTINKHYFELRGKELEIFKASHQIEDNLKFAPVIYLWTEKGAWLHAKSLNTDRAWEAYEMLVDNYYSISQEKALQQFNIPQNYVDALYLAANLESERAKLAHENHLLEQNTMEQQTRLLEQETPVAIYNLAISAKNTMTMQEVAKSLNTGRTRLYNILREEGVIMKNSTMPYQRYLDAGYFKVTERPRASGDTIINDPATRVYAKGFDFIARIMKKRAETIGQST